MKKGYIFFVDNKDHVSSVFSVFLKHDLLIDSVKIRQKLGEPLALKSKHLSKGI